jgi:hypothetical protein
MLPMRDARKKFLFFDEMLAMAWLEEHEGDVPSTSAHARACPKSVEAGRRPSRRRLGCTRSVPMGALPG